MTARCKNCNKYNSFNARKGFKLKNASCINCGSHNLERLGTFFRINGYAPFDSLQHYDFDNLPFFYADRNSKGEFFVLFDGKYSPIIVEQIGENYFYKS